MTLLTLICEKDRHAEPFSNITLEMVPAGTTVVIDDGATAVTSSPGPAAVAKRLGPQQKRVLEAVQTAPGGLSNEEWMEGAGVPQRVPERTFYDCKKRLIAERLVILRDDRRYVAAG